VNFGGAREGGVRLAHYKRRAGHRLNAAGNGEIVFASGDGASGRADGFQAGSTKAIDRRTGNVDRKARKQKRHASDVAIVFTGLIGAAEDDFVELLPVGGGVSL